MSNQFSYSTLSKHDTAVRTSVATGRKFISEKNIVQPKLSINSPDDQYEKEADAMADRVMRMEIPDARFKPLPISSLQRKCAVCEEEENKIQRKEMSEGEQNAESAFESYVDRLPGSGQPLPDKALNFYEPRFGYDFSNVRICVDKK